MKILISVFLVVLFVACVSVPTQAQIPPDRNPQTCDPWIAITNVYYSPGFLTFSLDWGGIHCGYGAYVFYAVSVYHQQGGDPEVQYAGNWPAEPDQPLQFPLYGALYAAMISAQVECNGCGKSDFQSTYVVFGSLAQMRLTFAQGFPGL